MDTMTLILADAALRARGIRAAARQRRCPPATVAAALSRLEGALAVRLMQKAGGSLILTLEGTRLSPAIETLAGLASRLFAAREQPGTVSLDALARLEEVARSGSIRAAARAIGLGQPQLTRQIAHVEAALGVAVFERGREGARLTPAGHSVIETVGGIGRLWSGIADTAADRFRRSEATVRIGSVIPLGPDSRIAELLAHLAAGWQVRHPRQPLFIASMIAEDLLSGLKRGQFDIVFLDVERLPDDLDGQRLSASPLTLVGPAQRLRGLAVGDRRALAERLSAGPLALPSRRSGLRQMIDPLLDVAGRASDPVEIDSIPVILRLVTGHGFLSILPGASLSLLDPAIARLELPAEFTLPLWIAWPKARSGEPAQRQVLALMR